MKRFTIAIALSCILFGLAEAGEVPMVGPAPPPPGAMQTTTGKISSVPGQIPSDGAAELSDATLSAVLAVLSLLS